MQWQKASASFDKGACVEVARLGDGIAVRDSKRPEDGWLNYTTAEWAAFLDGVKKGEFDHFAL